MNLVCVHVFLLRKGLLQFGDLGRFLSIGTALGLKYHFPFQFRCSLTTSFPARPQLPNDKNRRGLVRHVVEINNANADKSAH